MKTIPTLMSLGLLAASLLAPLATASDARVEIETAINEVTAILHDEAMAEAEKREKVVAIVDEVLDIEVMSRLVMASTLR